MFCLFLFIILLVPQESPCEVVWSGEAKPGFTIGVDASSQSVSIDEKLQITLIASSPKGYQVNRELLRRNLLDDLGFGPPPFSLLSEEVVLKEHNTQRIIYTLDPQLPGNYSLSFGKVSFESNEPEKLPVVALMSGTFPIETTMSIEKVDYKAPLAPLMELSTRYPINVDARNTESYLTNSEILKEQMVRHRKIFSSGGDSTIAFIILLVLKLLIVLIAIWQMIRKKEVREPLGLVQISAKERARYALKKLHKDTEDVPEGYPVYHAKVSEIIRVFLEEVSGIHASKMTTQELFTHQEPFSDPQKKLLREFMMDVDKVKFTPCQPSKDEFDKIHETAKHIIHELMPEEPKHIVSQGIAFWGLSTLLRNYFKKRISRD
ncbi:MAG: hypothetical protein AAGG81_04870 [Chlamydiota bacterium]